MPSFLFLWFLGVFPKSQFSIFTYQKRSQTFRESLCIPLGKVGEIEKDPQYSLKTPKYTTSDPYLIPYNLLFDIKFCIHNNLNMIIKKYELFTCRLRGSFLPLRCIGIMSLGSTNLKKVSMIRQK